MVAKSLPLGEWFRIDKEENGEWKEAEKINDQYAFIAIGWIIKGNGEFKDDIDWSNYYGELKEGNYRIVKEVYKDGNKKELYANFIIK